MEAMAEVYIKATENEDAVVIPFDGKYYSVSKSIKGLGWSIGRTETADTDGFSRIHVRIENVYAIVGCTNRLYDGSGPDEPKWPKELSRSVIFHALRKNFGPYLETQRMAIHD